MTREEIIEILIRDKINEWVHAMCHEGLEEILYYGWKGYSDYTNQELLDIFVDQIIPENFAEADAKKIMMEQNRIKREGKMKNLCN